MTRTAAACSAAPAAASPSTATSPGDKVDIWMGTLSKAYASCGGYIAGNEELIDTLRYAAPGFVFSVGLPPSMTAAALAALRVIKREPERVARLHANGALFLARSQGARLDTGRSIGIGMLPMMVGATTRAAKAVIAGCSSAASTPRSSCRPGVPVNAARLRFFLTSRALRARRSAPRSTPPAKC